MYQHLQPIIFMKLMPEKMKERKIKNEPDNSNGASSLRLRAEERLINMRHETKESFSETDQLKLLHELQVHQVELEMQNEELLLARDQEKLASDKFTSLFDFAPSAYFTLTVNGNIADLNIAGARMLGKERNLLINNRFSSFLVPESRKSFSDLLEKLSKGESHQACDITFSTENKSCVYAHLNGTLSNNGRYYWLNAVDITARRQAEEVLRMSEKDLRESQRIAHVGSWRLDLATNQVFWTEELYRMYGFDPTIPPPPYTEHMKLFTPESWERLSSALALTRETGIPYTLELETIKKDGSNGWVWVRGEADMDLTGKITSLWGAAKDISWHKNAEIELRWRNADLQLMNAINHAANSNENLSSIIDLMASQLKETFNSYLLSVFIPDEESREMKMYGSTLDNDLVQKIEKLTGKALPSIVLGLDKEHPFSQIELSRTGLLSVGKKEVTNRLAGYLKGTPWPAMVQKMVKKLLPVICEIIGYQSSVAVPMISKGNIIGYLELGSRDVMTESDLIRIQSIADHLATVILKYNTESKLHESEERMTNAFNYASIGMAFVAPDGRWLKVNHAVPKMFGYSEEELLSKTFQQITHHDDLSKDLDNVSQLLKGLISTYQMEKRYFHKSGSIIWGLLSVSLVHDHEGKPLHFISQIQDITERKQAEETTRESEKKFRTLYETMAQGVVYQDGTGAIIHANPAAERILGLNLSQMQGRSSVDPRWHSVHEDGSPFPGNTHPAITALSTGKEISEVMGVFNPLDEKYHWIIVNAIPGFRNGDDKPDQVFTTFEDITELKNAFNQINKAKEVLEFKVEERTRELMQINNFQKAILDNAPFAIFTLDTNGIYQSVNPAGETMTGYTSNEIIGKMSPLQFHDREELFRFCTETTGNPDPCEKDVYEAALEAIFNKTTEWHWIRKNGERFPIKISHSPLIGSDGIINGHVGLVLDISKENEYIDSLRKSEAENRAILQSVPDLMFRIHRDGTYIDAHTQDDSSLYVPKEKFVGKNIREIMPSVMAEEAMQAIGKALDSGEVVQYEYSLPVNEKNCFFENRIISISNNEVLSIIRDITYRKEAETALKMQSAAFESFVLAIIITDIKGRIKWANSAFSRLTGYSIEEAIGKMPGELVKSGKQDKEFYANFWNTILEKKVWSGELINRKKDGMYYYEEEIITPVLDSLGNISSFIAIKIDISERKLAEEALRNARMDAEMANLAKSEFLANMSHEIRTPMNAILGYSQLLGNLVKEKIQKDYLTSIISSGRSLLTLINDILDLSKIEAGKLELEFDYIETELFFSEFEKIFSFKLTEKGLKFTTEIASGTPASFYLDGHRLRQVILNIVGNAVKFTKKGEISIKIRSENPQFVNYSETKHEELIDLVIEISDTGIGIPEAFMKDIFESFIQVRSKSNQGGTGLGLTITQRLVQLMNGTINVRSELGKGSTFIILIPNLPFLRIYKSLNTTFELNSDDIIFEKATILVVDDVDGNRKLLIDALREREFNFLEAANGISALEIMKKNKPDLVISDIRMPAMNGFELLAKIKSDPKLKHIPVIAYSASVMKEQKEKIFNSEFADLLIKPVQISELYQALMNSLPHRLKAKTKSEIALIIENPDEEITDYTGLMAELNGKYYRVWESFGSRQPIGEVKKFGEALTELGYRHNCKIISGYGINLINATDRLDITMMLKLLGQYNENLETLKKLLRNR